MRAPLQLFKLSVALVLLPSPSLDIGNREKYELENDQRRRAKPGNTKTAIPFRSKRNDEYCGEFHATSARAMVDFTPSYL